MNSFVGICICMQYLSGNRIQLWRHHILRNDRRTKRKIETHKITCRRHSKKLFWTQTNKLEMDNITHDTNIDHKCINSPLRMINGPSIIPSNSTNETRDIKDKVVTGSGGDFLTTMNPSIDSMVVTAPPAHSKLNAEAEFSSSTAPPPISTPTTTSMTTTTTSTT